MRQLKMQRIEKSLLDAISPHCGGFPRAQVIFLNGLMPSNYLNYEKGMSFLSLELFTVTPVDVPCFVIHRKNKNYRRN